MPFVALIGLALTAATVLAWWRIFWRLGWPPIMALIMAVPFVSVVVVLFVAFTRWPIEERLEALQNDLKRLRGEM